MSQCRSEKIEVVELQKKKSWYRQAFEKEQSANLVIVCHDGALELGSIDPCDVVFHMSIDGLA